MATSSSESLPAATSADYGRTSSRRPWFDSPRCPAVSRVLNSLAARDTCHFYARTALGAQSDSSWDSRNNDQRPEHPAPRHTEERIGPYQAFAQSRAVAVIGNLGTGKSFLGAHLISTMIKDAMSLGLPPNLTPVLVRLAMCALG